MELAKIRGRLIEITDGEPKGQFVCLMCERKTIGENESTK